MTAVSGFLKEAGFTHSLTPARNCTFGCTYCYVPTLRVFGGLKKEDWTHWGQFTTFKPNAVVAPIHPKAMPVILTKPEEFETWMTGTTAEALRLQRPLPDAALSVVARGEKQDPPTGSPEMAPALLL